MADCNMLLRANNVYRSQVVILFSDILDLDKIVKGQHISKGAKVVLIEGTVEFLYHNIPHWTAEVL